MVSLHRIDAIRLKDFKATLDRHSNYRFYIKTEDPDCGVVKEEVGVSPWVIGCVSSGVIGGCVIRGNRWVCHQG